VFQISDVGNFRVDLNPNDSYENYFYNRLAVETAFQHRQTNADLYDLEVRSLAKDYLTESGMAQSQMTISQGELEKANSEIDGLRTEVASLRGELAKTNKSELERWLPICVPILSLLMAISTSVLAWRADRRQLREADLVPLKRQELEQGVLNSSYQLQQTTCRLVTPTNGEIERYGYNSSNISSSI